jgi:hypothetical protein
MYMNTLAKPHFACARELTSFDKWRFTLYTTVLLVILFNPWMYIFVNKLLGSLIGSISNKEGCPTIMGFVVHAVVFTLILRLLMSMDI